MLAAGPDARRHVSSPPHTPLISGCSHLLSHTANTRGRQSKSRAQQMLSPRCIIPLYPFSPLIHGDAQLPQLPLGDLYLAHELVVRLGDVVEGQDAPAEADEQVGAEGDEGPEGQDGDDLGLDDGGEGDQVEVEGEVGLLDCVS